MDGISNETLLNTRYSNSLVWEIDDVYLLEKDGAISYRIELETTSSIKPEIDMALIYDRQGILLNEYEIMDRDELKPLEIPTNILQWITDHFPNSDVLDYECDIEDHEIEHEIDLLQNNIVIEIELIEVNGMLTIEEIEFNYPNLNSLPEDIRIIAIQKIEDLVNFTLEDICEIEMEIQENGDEEYEIELRNDMSEIEVSIIRDKEGVIK